MSLRGLVSAGRARAEAIMTDTLRITTPGRTYDAETMTYTASGSVIYEGKGRIQSGGIQPVEGEVAGYEYAKQRTVAQVPITAPRPPVGAVVTVVASEMNPSLVGATYAIKGRDDKSHATMQRLVIEEAAT